MSNPLEAYRITQRELRRQFEGFTKVNCAACPTPCCRQPARILPSDILLAESTGWRANLTLKNGDIIKLESKEGGAELDQHREENDITSRIAGRMASALSSPPETGEANLTDIPCEFLGERGCTFPTDLRPFGCTTFICRYMYAKMDRRTLTRIKRLVRELEDRHQFLMKRLNTTSGKSNEN